MEGRVKTTTSDMHRNIKFWSWAIFILAVAILLTMIIFHFAYWLMWVGAFTVIALALGLGIYVVHVAHKIKDDI